MFLLPFVFGFFFVLGFVNVLSSFSIIMLVKRELSCYCLCVLFPFLVVMDWFVVCVVVCFCAISSIVVILKGWGWLLYFGYFLFVVYVCVFVFVLMPFLTASKVKNMPVKYIKPVWR